MHREALKTLTTPAFTPSLYLSQTLCATLLPGKKKLKDLGEVLGVEKVDIDSAQKEHMKGLLADDPALYMEYASTDSVVTVLYASAMYGYNNALPVTVTSATAGVMKETMMKYLECESTEEFNRVYRGLEKVNHGNYKIQDRPGFVEATSLEPISNDVNTIQYYASQGLSRWLQHLHRSRIVSRLKHTTMTYETLIRQQCVSYQISTGKIPSVAK
jgi:hypothetical protein